VTQNANAEPASASEAMQTAMIAVRRCRTRDALSVDDEPDLGQGA
jgi:hypothetical protein